MGSQTLELKWANHKANMTLELQELYLNDALLDVTIACGEFSLKAHKTVLSASSTFFRKLFIDNPCKHPILIMTDVDFEDLKTIVEFMYQGEIHISREKLSQFLKTADRLKIKGLSCIEDMNLNPSKQTEANVEPNYSNDAWECANTPPKLQDASGREKVQNSPSKLTECTQNSINQQIETVKVEDSPQPKNSCIYWQNGCFDQTSNLLPDCNLPSPSAVSHQLPTSISHQSAAASVAPQLSTFSASVHMTASASLDELPTPASHQHRVTLSNENFTYPESQSDSRALAQMQEESIGKEVIPVNLYHSEGQSSLTIPSGTTSLDVVESLSNQSSSQTNKTDHSSTIGEELCSIQGVVRDTTEGGSAVAVAFYKCDTCSKRFIRKETLKRHISNVHSTENKLVCTMCGYRFDKNYKFSMHIRQHMKPYECKLCHKRFSQTSNLYRHERTHTGEKPFKCKLCNRCFSQSCNLKQHERIHTGEKAYKCNICDSEFIYYNCLMKHIEIHLKGK